MLIAIAAGFPHSATGLPVTIARVEACRGHNDNRTIVVRVLSHGGLRINAQDLNREDLEGRLEEIFKTRVYRHIFLMSDSDVPFGQVAEMIGVATKQVEVSIMTPSAGNQARAGGPFCLADHIPKNYIARQ